MQVQDYPLVPYRTKYFSSKTGVEIPNWRHIQHQSSNLSLSAVPPYKVNSRAEVHASPRFPRGDAPRNNSLPGVRHVLKSQPKSSKQFIGAATTRLELKADLFLPPPYETRFPSVRHSSSIRHGLESDRKAGLSALFPEVDMGLQHIHLENKPKPVEKPKPKPVPKVSRPKKAPIPTKLRNLLIEIDEKTSGISVETSQVVETVTYARLDYKRIPAERMIRKSKLIVKTESQEVATVPAYEPVLSVSEAAEDGLSQPHSEGKDFRDDVDSSASLTISFDKWEGSESHGEEEEIDEIQKQEEYIQPEFEDPIPTIAVERSTHVSRESKPGTAAIQPRATRSSAARTTVPLKPQSSPVSSSLHESDLSPISHPLIPFPANPSISLLPIVTQTAIFVEETAFPPLETSASEINAEPSAVPQLATSSLVLSDDRKISKTVARKPVSPKQGHIKATSQANVILELSEDSNAGSVFDPTEKPSLLELTERTSLENAYQPTLMTTDADLSTSRRTLSLDYTQEAEAPNAKITGKKMREKVRKIARNAEIPEVADGEKPEIKANKGKRKSPSKREHTSKKGEPASLEPESGKEIDWDDHLSSRSVSLVGETPPPPPAVIEKVPVADDEVLREDEAKEDAEGGAAAPSQPRRRARAAATPSFAAPQPALRPSVLSPKLLLPTAPPRPTKGPDPVDTFVARLSYSLLQMINDVAESQKSAAGGKKSVNHRPSQMAKPPRASFAEAIGLSIDHVPLRYTKKSQSKQRMTSRLAVLTQRSSRKRILSSSSSDSLEISEEELSEDSAIARHQQMTDFELKHLSMLRQIAESLLEMEEAGKATVKPEDDPPRVEKYSLDTEWKNAQGDWTRNRDFTYAFRRQSTDTPEKERVKIPANVTEILNTHFASYKQGYNSAFTPDETYEFYKKRSLFKDDEEPYELPEVVEGDPNNERAELERKRFQSRQAVKQLYEQGTEEATTRLIQTGHSHLHSKERTEIARRTHANRTRRNEVETDRGGQSHVVLHAKSTYTFTGLNTKQKIRSVTQKGHTHRTSGDLVGLSHLGYSYSERIYLRLKGSLMPSFLSASRHSSSIPSNPCA